MIQPVSFRMNEQTAVNNYYQKTLESLTPENVQERALVEFTRFVNKLEDKGINVIVIEDTLNPDTPDSIFPNNWISFHEDARVAYYPMFALNRRAERREDVVEIIRNNYGLSVKEIVDFTEFESHDKFLEGTGSLVLDRENKICYAAISVRTDKAAAAQFCEQFGYSLCSFSALQSAGDERKTIYHTNVMMCIADKYAVICLDTIDSLDERMDVISALEDSGKEIIEISEEQKEHFAGNMLQVMNEDGRMARLDDLFKFLSIPGITGEEEKIALAVKEDLIKSGVPEKYIIFDNVHKEIPLPTQVGNLIVKLPGTIKAERIMFSCHLDTVPLCKGNLLQWKNINLNKYV